MDKASSKEFTLLLSVCKGVNFVVKRPGVLMCKLVCRLNEKVCESDPYYLRTSSTEPDFNYQAAWKLSKKELQELRLNRDVVKIECHLLDKEGTTESIIGYCSVSVKDAIEIPNFEQIDSKSAGFIPLKGTRQPWNSFKPQLQLILYFEDPGKNLFPASKRKMALPKSPTKKDGKIKVPPPVSANVPKFSWSINNEMGYFQLGSPGPNDDLYVMNITLVSVKNLEHLLNQKPPDLEDCKWRIRFNCFGMTIDSDIFTLNSTEESPQTYLGDKSTGRVRASETEFTRFLSQFILEMKIETVRDSKTELQGTAWTELISLVDPEVFEIRSMIDIVPEKLAKLPEQFSPQLSHIVDIKKCSRFFANYIKLEEISFAGQNMTTSKEDLSQFKNQDHDNSSKKFNKFQAETPQNDYDRESFDVDLARTMQNLAVAEVGAGDENSLRLQSHVIRESVVQELEPKEDINKIFVGECRDQPKTTTKPSTRQSVPHNASTYASAISASTTHTTTTISRKEELPSPVIKPASRGKSIGSSTVRNSSECCPPGDYDLSLKFRSFQVKANVLLKDGWMISFFHPPLSVEVDDMCELRARLESVKDKVYTFYFDEDENENWGLTIPKFFDEILNTPLRVNFYTNTENGALNRSEPVGYSDVPLGTIFITKKEGHCRKIEGSAKIFRNTNNPIKIGHLTYEFTLTEKTDHGKEHYETYETYNGVHGRSSNHNHSPELFTPVASERKSRDSSKTIRKAAASEKDYAGRLDDEERLFKERLKEKEKAYLQMLSQEHKKQKEESEKAVNEKLSELERQKKEYTQKLRSVQEREEHLKSKEAELADSVRTSSMESTKLIEELKLKIKRLEAEKKIEVDAIGKRLDTALTDLEIANGRILLFEKKVEAKEDEIFKLRAERSNWPETETIRKVDKLHQQNIQLKKELAKAVEEKEHYKSQTQKIARELQFKSEESQEQLRIENDNLKLQMLASREHELLNRDIQQVATVSHEIRKMKDTFEREKVMPLRGDSVHFDNNSKRKSRPGKVDCLPENISRVNGNENSGKQNQEASIDREIERLSKSREKLLKTQAYTPYDSLIRNIEAEILKLLQQKNELMEKNESRGKGYSYQ